MDAIPYTHNQQGKLAEHYYFRPVDIIAHVGEGRHHAWLVLNRRPPAYIFTGTLAIHGTQKGALTVRYPGLPDLAYSIEPSQVRRWVEMILEVKLDPRLPLYITPCYPALINRKLGAKLAEHNVFILGDWKGPTLTLAGQCVFQDVDKKFYLSLSG